RPRRRHALLWPALVNCKQNANDCIMNANTNIGDLKGGVAMSRMKVSAVGITMLAATSGFAWAQDATSSPKPTRPTSTELEEVVVTAAKAGAQSLQDVPLAIQAFSGEDLKDKNITSIDDLVSAVPGAF